MGSIGDKSYLCAYDSSYAMEGYVAAIRKIGEDELAQHLSDILSEDIENEIYTIEIGTRIEGCKTYDGRHSCKECDVGYQQQPVDGKCVEINEAGTYE